MQFEWPRLVIPSYGRPLTIGQQTLHFLKSIGYPSSKIFIFVSDSDQAKTYKSWIDEHLYGQIIVGVLGLKEQRNFISDWLSEDEIYISMDDDLQHVKMMHLNGIGKSFLDLIKDAVSKISTRQYGLAGCLSNSDARRFKNDYTQHLSHIVGCFWIARNDKIRIEGLSEKEDYERSIKYFSKYGKVLRYRWAGVQTQYVKGQGGIAKEGRKDREAEAVLYLTTKFPDLCSRINKKGDWPDLKLNWRAKKPNS
jgi:hypothetical protein